MSTLVLSVSASKELIDRIPPKGSKNTAITDFIRDYLINKPEIPDLSNVDCSARTSFTLRFPSASIKNAFMQEANKTLRGPSNLLNVILATMLVQK